jgi:hypothetical protein
MATSNWAGSATCPAFSALLVAHSQSFRCSALPSSIRLPPQLAIGFGKKHVRLGRFRIKRSRLLQPRQRGCGLACEFQNSPEKQVRSVMIWIEFEHPFTLFDRFRHAIRLSIQKLGPEQQTAPARSPQCKTHLSRLIHAVRFDEKKACQPGRPQGTNKKGTNKNGADPPVYKTISGTIAQDTSCDQAAGATCTSTLHKQLGTVHAIDRRAADLFRLRRSPHRSASEPVSVSGQQVPGQWVNGCQRAEQTVLS